MSQFVLFSKTLWAEPPRLRHQFANMLTLYGNEVVFFEKPRFPYQTAEMDRERFPASNGNIIVAQGAQIIHHQLRVFGALSQLNAAWEARSIRKAAKALVGESAIVINFNYDYYFLRRVFKFNKIVTVINDDFIAQAKFFARRHVKARLRETCRMSDTVLTVSYPLMAQLADWCSPVLFLPWADCEYRAPSVTKARNGVLLWGHIDRRIDFELLSLFSEQRPGVMVYIVGPVSSDVEGQLLLLKQQRTNVITLPPTQLDSLPLDLFFAAIIPYKKNVGDIEAVTLSNKSFQLMSRGLPLIVHGMPSFLEHEAVFKCASALDAVVFADRARECFLLLQSAIRQLIQDNQVESRYEQFRAAIGDF